MSTREERLREIFANMGNTKRLQSVAFSHVLQGMRVSPTQAHLLFLIQDVQPVSLKQLAEQMHLTPGAITQLVDGIEQYIVRKQLDEDRRVTCVSLSPEGVQAVTQLKKHREEFLRKLLGQLDDQELEVFAKVQQKMVDYFTQYCSGANKKEKVHE